MPLRAEFAAFVGMSPGLVDRCLQLVGGPAGVS
jgi:hypothetical protein